MLRLPLAIVTIALVTHLLAPRAATAAAPVDEPVTVTGVHRGDGNAAVLLDVNVFSGGCTRAADFSVDVHVVDGVQHARVVRHKQDVCEAYVPAGAKVVLAAPGLSLERPIVVDNPLFVPAR